MPSKANCDCSNFEPKYNTMKVKINNQIYKVKTKWPELTIADAIALSEIELPEGLQDYFEKGAEVSELQAYKTFPAYYGECLKVLSEIPTEVIDKISPIDRTWLFKEMIMNVALGVAFGYPIGHEDQPFEGVEIDGVKYFYPDKVTINGKEVPFYDVSTKQFAEMADFMGTLATMNEKKWQSIAMLMAIVLLPEGETYSEAAVLQRVELFKGVKMNLVWDFFRDFTLNLSALEPFTHPFIEVVAEA